MPPLASLVGQGSTFLARPDTARTSAEAASAGEEDASPASSTVPHVRKNEIARLVYLPRDSGHCVIILGSLRG